MTDAQDRAEQFDTDKIAVSDTDTPVQDLEYPPDEPVGVDEYGTTPAEERVDEPLEERILREEPEELPDPDGMRLVEPDAGAGTDTEADAVARAANGSDLSAEEDAVHLTEPPPMGDGDGYIDES